jgi:ABC-type tungstate transport system permease subunit
MTYTEHKKAKQPKGTAIMNSIIKELYEVAQEFASNPQDCSTTQYEDALKVIEYIEDGEDYKAIQVGLVF